jgi:hypothetical protein
VGEQEHRPAVTQDVRDLRRRQEQVHRDDDRAQPGRYAERLLPQVAVGDPFLASTTATVSG